MTSDGGFNYTLDFTGLREFASRSDSLQYVSDPDDTNAEVREGITRMIALGMVPYVTSTAIARQLRIAIEAAPLADPGVRYLPLSRVDQEVRDVPVLP
jgi:hypothetical protein